MEKTPVPAPAMTPPAAEPTFQEGHLTTAPTLDRSNSPPNDMAGRTTSEKGLCRSNSPSSDREVTAAGAAAPTMPEVRNLIWVYMLRSHRPRFVATTCPARAPRSRREDARSLSRRASFILAVFQILTFYTLAD